MTATNAASTPSVGVVGCGVMGSGIAQALAVAGCDVVAYDVSVEQLDQARRSVERGRYGLERGVERGKLTEAAAADALRRLTFSSSFEEAAACDLVIESVVEDLAVKIDVFRSLDRVSPPHAVLASNTSGLPIVAMAKATDRPELVIGWHWASPPVVMPMAEIVVTPFTDSATVDAVTTLARACGKRPIVVQDLPPSRPGPAVQWGFGPNRVLSAMVAEAQRVVSDGVCTAEELDQLCKDCFNWPAGPFGIVAGARSNWSERSA